jgi:hypothetical protein
MVYEEQDTFILRRFLKRLSIRLSLDRRDGRGSKGGGYMAYEEEDTWHMRRRIHTY